MNQNITVIQSPTQEKNKNSATLMSCKLCKLALLQSCMCQPIQTDFIPSNSSAVMFKGLVANNPNNPGINLKQGRLSFSEIESIPIAQICKVKLCQRNEFMYINTLQIYSSHSENKPVYLGVDLDEASHWLICLIQAKLILSHKINIGNQRPSPQKITGILFKRSVLGKWKQHQATCITIPPYKCLKLEEQYSVVNSTSQIWTRFESVEIKGINCLVIKLWGTLGKKELAIPLPQLALWLRAMCSLLS